MKRTLTNKVLSLFMAILMVFGVASTGLIVMAVYDKIFVGGKIKCFGRSVRHSTLPAASDRSDPVCFPVIFLDCFANQIDELLSSMRSRMRQAGMSESDIHAAGFGEPTQIPEEEETNGGEEE